MRKGAASGQIVRSNFDFSRLAHERPFELFVRSNQFGFESRGPQSQRYAPIPSGRACGRQQVEVAYHRAESLPIWKLTAIFVDRHAGRRCGVKAIRHPVHGNLHDGIKKLENIFR